MLLFLMIMYGRDSAKKVSNETADCSETRTGCLIPSCGQRQFSKSNQTPKKNNESASLPDFGMNDSTESQSVGSTTTLMKRAAPSCRLLRSPSFCSSFRINHVVLMLPVAAGGAGLVRMLGNDEIVSGSRYFGQAKPSANLGATLVYTSELPTTTTNGNNQSELTINPTQQLRIHILCKTKARLEESGPQVLLVVYTLCPSSLVRESLPQDAR
jgi:hypothetical protein